jgi:hypothetical protein
MVTAMPSMLLFPLKMPWLRHFSISSYNSSQVVEGYFYPLKPFGVPTLGKHESAPIWVIFYHYFMKSHQHFNLMCAKVR